MTISRTVVKKPRKARWCGNHAAGQYLIPAGTPQVRLYGYAHYGDKPYVLWLCVDCDGAYDHPDEKRG